MYPNILLQDRHNWNVYNYTFWTFKSILRYNWNNVIYQHVNILKHVAGMPTQSVFDCVPKRSNFSFSNITFCRRVATYNDSRTKGKIVSTKSPRVPLFQYMLQSFSFILISTHHLFDFSECTSPESASFSH